MFALLVILFFFLDIMMGSVTLSPSGIFHSLFRGGDPQVHDIIMKFRIPKALTAVLVGLALSVSGLQMQTVFRNPVAGPYVLGISSGASLGVAFVILGFHGYITSEGLQWYGNWALAAASWIGAGTVMLLIMIISVRVRDILTVLIIGILLSGAISAVVSIMQYFSNETMLKAYVVWTMGSLGNLTSGQITVLALSVGAGLILSLLSVKMLNALLLGENYAMTMGLNLNLARFTVFAATSILAGSVTAFCGPIGFIGIAVPHISRMIFRTSDHRVLMPASILAGSVIMLLSDILTQLPGSGRIIPINSVTSLVGIPIVIWVIFRNRKYTET
ncbi:MAG TPA: iron ABC transporter permease [Bacteroidales bacterium]|nr:iron ABC transporter permease [Bacteroidales bacterium]